MMGCPMRPMCLTVDGPKALSIAIRAACDYKKAVCQNVACTLSPCLAGLDPASHSVKQVGTQRVALDRDSMGLRVKPAKTQAHFDTPPLLFLRMRL